MRVSTNQFHSQGINSIQKAQAEVMDAQLKLSTGKRVNAASDDPVATSQIHSLNRTMSTLDQYAKNGDFAKSQLAIEEIAVTDVINNVQRARDLTLQMMNGTYSENDRSAASSEIGQIIQQLSSQMNLTNSQGEKIFAGNNVDAEQAYVDDVVNPGYKSYIGHSNAGSATVPDTAPLYNADNLYDERANYGARFVQIGFDADNKLSANNEGDSGRVRLTDNGSDIFTIPDGVTQFKTAQFETVLPDVAVIESGIGQSESAEFKFYPMTEGQAITIAGLTYTADSAMTANDVAGAFSDLADGAETGPATATGTYSGTLTDWKSGTVANGNEVVFTTTEGVNLDVTDISVSKNDHPPELNILNVLIELKRDLDNNDVSNMGDYAKDMQASISQASVVRTEIGGRQNRIESQYNAGESFKLALEERRMGLEDMDLVKGITDLTQNQNALEMAQQVFTRVQSMSLFDYLR